MANVNHYLTPLFHVCYLTFVCLGLATSKLPCSGTLTLRASKESIIIIIIVKKLPKTDSVVNSYSVFTSITYNTNNTSFIE